MTLSFLASKKESAIDSFFEAILLLDKWFI